MSVLDLLRSAADPRWITVAPGPELRVEARLELPDGEPLVFGLRIAAAEGSASPQVWEEGTNHLPRCPARHFYADWSFCMGYGLSGPPPVTNLELARAWWAVLHGYLELQVIATLTGTWPPQNARAHGLGAAAVEEVADWAERLLPPGILDRIRDGRLTLSGLPGRVSPRWSPCPCGSGRPLRDCHEFLVSNILTLRSEQTKMETQFWAAHTDHPCCGTMRGCPLSRPSPTVTP